MCVIWVMTWGERWGGVEDSERAASRPAGGHQQAHSKQRAWHGRRLADRACLRRACQLLRPQPK